MTSDSEDGFVAIVGTACRFPGAEDIDQFWETLKDGKNHMKVIPEERFNVNAIYDEDFDAPGKSYVKMAALEESIYEWDNTVFKIHELEAMRMDPQQKEVLEVTFRALENGGITEEKIFETNTAVYIGQMSNDYAKLVEYDSSFTNNYTASGSAQSILANRVSYTFNLHGPSVSLDTACSSSLVAVHFGINSILSGESSMAICGGVNLILSPGPFVAVSKAMMASRKGQCHAFSEEADGYARGEGCGIVILKSLEKAIEDKNNIWGIIKTGCNSDGRSAVPISYPSLTMQKQLITSVFEKANRDLADVQYIEMHGTGTPTGDPVETSAVGETIGQARKSSNLGPVQIGSVKSNIGHLEAAAGVAGLIKTLLMMKHEQYVKSLFSDNLNSKINFQDLNIQVVKQPQTWEKTNQGKRIASVNSFGFGGTNVHAIVEQICNPTEQKVVSQQQPYYVILFSGKSKASVILSVEDTIKAIKKELVTNIPALEYTSINRRNQYSYRIGISIPPEIDAGLSKLERAIVEIKTKQSVPKVQKDVERKNIIFVFSGMGTHWHQMGYEFYKTVTIFRQTIDELDEHFLPLSGFAIHDCLRGDHDVASPAFGQPALLGIQIALVRMLKYYGISPDVVIGHSVGEVTAAFISNCLSIKDVAKVIYHRSNLLQNVQGGSMMVVGDIPVAQIEKLIKEKALEMEISIAAYNSTSLCTLSGEKQAVAEFEKLLKDKFGAHFAKELSVKAAYHSQYMDPILQELSTELVETEHNPPSQVIKYISTVTGNCVESISSTHWARNVRNPVLFEKALKTGLDCKRENIIIEIGPKSALKRCIADNAKHLSFKVFTSMTENNSTEHFFNTVASLYENGLQVKLWTKDITSESFSYPRYGFDRKMLQDLTPKILDFLAGKKTNIARHPFVEGVVDHNEVSSIATVSPKTTAYVYDHKVSEDIIVPGTTFIEMLVATYMMLEPNIFNQGKCLSMKVNYVKRCIIDPVRSNKIQTTLFKQENPDSMKDMAWQFDVTTKNKLHATGKICTIDRCDKIEERKNVAFIKKRCTKHFSCGDLYKKLEAFDFSFGTLMKGVKSGQHNNSEILARVSVAENQYYIHPVLLDSLFQLSSIFPSVDGTGDHVNGIPIGIDQILINNIPPKDVLVYVKVRELTEAGMTLDGEILDENGYSYVQCRGMRVGIPGSEYHTNVGDMIYSIQWNDCRLEPPQKLEPDKKYVLISNYDSETLKKFEKAQVVGCTISLCDILRNENMEFSSFLVDDWTKHDGIIFAATELQLKEDCDAIVLNDKIRNLGYCLLRLVLYVQQNHPHLTVSLLTNQVHSIMNDTLPQSSEGIMDGLVGYSLWGTMRTVVMEFPTKSFKSIDLSDLSHKSLLSLDNFLTTDTDEREANISNGHVKTCDFVSGISQNRISKRQISSAESPNLKICAAKVTDEGYSDISIHETEDCNEKESNKRKINLISLYTCNPHSGMLTEVEKPIQCIGGKGVLNDGNNSSFDKDVHVVQLIPACNSFQINEKLMIPGSTFPSQYPTAPVLFLAWMMCHSVEKSIKGIQLLAFNSDKALATAIKQAYSLMSPDFSCMENDTRKHVFIFANEWEDIKEHLVNANSHGIAGITVLTWRTKSKELIQNYLKEYASTITKKVMVVEEIFSQEEYLECKMKEFRTWLQSVGLPVLKQTILEINAAVKESDKVFTLSEIQKPPSICGGSIILTSSNSKGGLVTLTKSNMFKKCGSYLVFGGSKGLGLEVVIYLIKNGAGRIGIVSRNGVSNEQQHELAKLCETFNCIISDLKADVIEYAEVSKVVHTFIQDFPQYPLKGIFMGTVVIDDKTVPNMTIKIFEYALKPKVMGIWNIHKIVKDLPLDYFVIHSALAGMLGNPGQSNYATANTFLDAFACYRRQKYGVGQTICWGAMNLGLLENVNKKQSLIEKGAILMKKHEIISCFEHTILTDMKKISYAKFNWPIFINKTVPAVYVQRSLKRLISRKCHYLERTNSTLNTLRNSQKNVPVDHAMEDIHKLLQRVLMLDDEIIENDFTLEMLGADSHDTTVIYSFLVQMFGNRADIIPGRLSNLTVNDLHTKIINVT